MDNDDERPHAIYRYRGRRDELLYIGRTNNVMRRTNEHRLDKEWITSAVRIDLEWVPAGTVHELERLAIESEHPIYNVQHNRGRIRVEVSAEVSLPDRGGIAAMVVLIAGGVLAAKWGLEAAANWNVRRRAARAGVTIDLPPARNPFADGGPAWLNAMLAEALNPSPSPYAATAVVLGSAGGSVSAPSE